MTILILATIGQEVASFMFWLSSYWKTFCFQFEVKRLNDLLDSASHLLCSTVHILKQDFENEICWDVLGDPDLYCQDYYQFYTCPLLNICGPTDQIVAMRDEVLFQIPMGNQSAVAYE